MYIYGWFPSLFTWNYHNIVNQLSVQFSCSVVSNTLQPHGLQHARLPFHHQLSELAQTHVHWIRDAIQSSYPLLSPSSLSLNLSQYQSFPVSQLFSSGGQSIGALVSASVLPMNIQGWFPLGLTGFISLQSKGFSRVFPNTTVRKHQFFSSSAFFMVQLAYPYMPPGKKQ